MHYSIIVFPGSNCDKDCADAIKINSENTFDFIWYQKQILPKTDCIIIPGGFSYGDYLRAGAIAKTAPIMAEVIKFANKGGLVLGVCNGFQILTETGLLPGALTRNNSLKFICQKVFLKVENNNTPFTTEFETDTTTELPIAHSEGNYYIDQNDYEKLLENNQIILRYCNENGSIDEFSNPNGSRYNIAGICNDKKNVFGLMPHPERYIDNALGSTSGLKIFKSIENHINNFGKE